MNLTPNFFFFFLVTNPNASELLDGKSGGPKLKNLKEEGVIDR
jgi:hypothetical protein